MIPETAQPDVTTGTLPGAHVEGDLPCRNCGYNLRSLDAAGLCPECGAAVSLSLRGDLLRFSSPEWLATLAYGMLYAIFGTVVSSFVAIVPFAASYRLDRSATLLGTSYWIGFNLIGAWLLTTKDPGASSEDKTATIRHTVRAAYLIVAAGIVFELMVPRYTTSAGLSAAIQLIFWFTDLTGIAGWVAELEYLQRLARRIPSRGDETYISILKLLGPICFTTWIVSYELRWHFSAWIPRASILTKLADAARVGYVGIVVAFIGSVVLLVRMRMHLKRQAALARADAVNRPAPPNAQLIP